MRVEEILEKKGREIVRITADKSVLEAVRLLVERNIGALVVVDASERPCGIISERDVLQQCAKRHEALLTTRVSDVMTRKVIFVAPGDDVEDVRDVMTKCRIRHLPVLDGEKLVGLVSSGDVMKVLQRRLEVENVDLKSFITARYIG